MGQDAKQGRCSSYYPLYSLPLACVPKLSLATEKTNNKGRALKFVYEVSLSWTDNKSNIGGFGNFLDF